MRSESRPCPISWLAVVTSLVVTYSSTTDCKVKLPARCPRSMSERRRRPSTASNTWTCESLATSTARSSSRVTGSRRIANQESTVCSRGESRAHCSSSSWVMLPKMVVPPERNWLISPPKRSAMVSATILKARTQVPTDLAFPEQALQVVEHQQPPPAAQLLQQQAQASLQTLGRLGQRLGRKHLQTALQQGGARRGIAQRAKDHDLEVVGQLVHGAGHQRRFANAAQAYYADYPAALLHPPAREGRQFLLAS